MTFSQSLSFAALASVSLVACTDPLDPDDPLGLQPLLEPIIESSSPPSPDAPDLSPLDAGSHPSDSPDPRPEIPDSQSLRALLANGATDVDPPTEWQCVPPGTAAGRTAVRLRIFLDGSGHYGATHRLAAVRWSLSGHDLSFELPETRTLVQFGDLCFTTHDRLQSLLVTSAGEAMSLVCDRVALLPAGLDVSVPEASNREGTSTGTEVTTNPENGFPFGTCPVHQRGDDAFTTDTSTDGGEVPG